MSREALEKCSRHQLMRMIIAHSDSSKSKMSKGQKRVQAEKTSFKSVLEANLSGKTRRKREISEIGKFARRCQRKKRKVGNQYDEDDEKTKVELQTPVKEPQGKLQPVDIIVTKEHKDTLHCLGARFKITEAQSLVKFYQIQQQNDPKSTFRHFAETFKMLTFPLHAVRDFSEFSPVTKVMNYERKSQGFKEFVLIRSGVTENTYDIEVVKASTSHVSQEHMRIAFAHLSWALRNEHPMDPQPWCQVFE